MTYRLSQAARTDGHRLHVHDQVASTNSEALALARAGETGPLWIAARGQTGGRGRRGTVWLSSDGNLAASLLWPVAGVAPEHVATLGFVAGLALAQALDDVNGNVLSHPRPHPEVPERSGGLEGDLQKTLSVLEAFFEAAGAAPQDEGAGGTKQVFRLKWPNDVLAGGKKLAGILLEAEGRRAVVIGFGVNVAAAPDGLPYPATALAALGCRAGVGALFEMLTARFVEAAAIWDRGRGFSRLRRLWLARAAGIGAPVSVTTQSGTLSGRHNGIDEGGRLVILAPDGTTHTVTAGEVHFGEAATAA